MGAIVWIGIGAIAVLVLSRLSTAAATVAALVVLVVGLLSLTVLVQLGFGVVLAPPISEALSEYDRVAHLALDEVGTTVHGYTAVWMERIGLRGALQPHWKHIFLAMMAYLLWRSVLVAKGSVPNAISIVLLGGAFSLWSGIVSGMVPLNEHDKFTAFVFAAAPILGLIVTRIFEKLAQVAFVPAVRRKSWRLRQPSSTALITQAVVALLIAAIGVRLEIVQELASPGLVVLGFLAFVHLLADVIGRSPAQAGSLRNKLLSDIDRNEKAVSEMGGWVEVYAEQPDIMRAKIKDCGRSLSTWFWDIHGEAIVKSSLPEHLRYAIRDYFTNVAEVRRAISDLASDSTPADYASVIRRCATIQYDGQSLRHRIPADFDDQV